MPVFAVLLMAGALATAAGCATPTPADMLVAQTGKQEAQDLLDAFAHAVREKDPAPISSLLSPTLRPREADQLEARLARASWLERYSGYAPDIDRALDQAGWRDWKGTELRLVLSGTGAFGPTTEDEITLAKAGGKWRISGCKMAEPRPGDALDPPQAVRQQVEPKVRHMMAELKEGRMAAIVYELPDKASARERPLTLSGWQSLWMSSTPGISVVEDLEMMRQFTVLAWPDPQAELQYVYDSSGTIAVFYEVPYVWLAGGIDKADILRLKFIFLKGSEGWTFYTVHLSAKAIPYS
jgi:hypothetical protein